MSVHWKWKAFGFFATSKLLVLCCYGVLFGGSVLLFFWNVMFTFVFIMAVFFASAYYQTITSTERRTMVFIILVRLTRRTEQMRLFDLQKQKANDALNFLPSISVFVFTCLAIASNDEACSMLHFATYIFNIPFTCQWINTVFLCISYASNTILKPRNRIGGWSSAYFFKSYQILHW